MAAWPSAPSLKFYNPLAALAGFASRYNLRKLSRKDNKQNRLLRELIEKSDVSIRSLRWRGRETGS